MLVHCRIITWTRRLHNPNLEPIWTRRRCRRPVRCRCVVHTQSPCYRDAVSCRSTKQWTSNAVNDADGWRWSESYAVTYPRHLHALEPWSVRHCSHGPINVRDKIRPRCRPDAKFLSATCRADLLCRFCGRQISQSEDRIKQSETIYGPKKDGMSFTPGRPTGKRGFLVEDFLCREENGPRRWFLWENGA